MQRGASKIATTQTLTANYAATNTIASFSINEETIGLLDISYTTGAAETNNSLYFKIEYSPDDGVTWIQESQSSLSSSVNTLTGIEHVLTGAAAGTTYTAQYMIPFCSRTIRVTVKESGVAANYGVLNMWLTVASDASVARNIQEYLPSTALSGLATETTLSTLNGKVTACNTGAVTISAALPAGTNAIGKLASNDGVDIGNVDVASVAAGTNTIGHVFQSPQVGTVFSGTATATVASAFANVAASQTDSSIVAANGSKVIYVLGFQAVCGATATNLTFNSKGGGAGTAISPLYANAANGGISCPPSGIPYFKTSAGEALTVTTGAGSTTGIIIQYIQV
ncbi:MAG: hypothetical protein A4E53_01722 [Pelotomaculum sp. PtaB.Bin104]|nr:MAG: hypothetical protein A4E53_01722 [Pelotomaculum sp. PtaB.Bin104]